MSKRFNYLRFAFSVFCGLACVLLVVLWVRSYWIADEAARGQSQVVGALSWRGAFALFKFDNRVAKAKVNPGWDLFSEPADSLQPYQPTLFIRRGEWPLGECLIVHYWVPILTLIAFAAFPWLRWRFSLRTLLIAMTVVAVAIGLIVALSR